MDSDDPMVRLDRPMRYVIEHGQLHRNVYPSAASQIAAAEAE
ncbi:hypothetical protein ACIHDR_38475 [Nocardia sp. NPDC052278]